LGNHILKISPNIIRVVSIMSKIGCHRFVVMASARLGNHILENNPKIIRIIPIICKSGSHSFVVMAMPGWKTTSWKTTQK
jgi:hypothetical protein